MAALNSDRGDRITATSGNMQWLTKENEVNQWRQVNYTFNSGDAEFIEVNIFVYNGITVDGTFAILPRVTDGYVCRCWRKGRSIRAGLLRKRTTTMWEETFGGHDGTDQIV